MASTHSPVPAGQQSEATIGKFRVILTNGIPIHVTLLSVHRHTETESAELRALGPIPRAKNTFPRFPAAKMQVRPMIRV